MAAAMPFAGTVFEIDTAGGTSWASVVDIEAVGLGDLTLPLADITVALSSNKWREKLGECFKDGGTVTLICRFHKTQYATWRTAFAAGTLITYRWSGPTLSGETTPTRINGTVGITRLGMPQKSRDGQQYYVYEVDLEHSGAVTFTAGS